MGESDFCVSCGCSSDVRVDVRDARGAVRDMCWLPGRARALAVAYLVERGDVGPDGVAADLQALGMTRSSAFRWQADYRRWLELGAP